MFKQTVDLPTCPPIVAPPSITSIAIGAVLHTKYIIPGVLLESAMCQPLMGHLIQLAAGPVPPVLLGLKF